MGIPTSLQRLWLGVSIAFAFSGAGVLAAFVNFETAPVHPVALSPDGRTLAICNLPDGRVELFDVSSGNPESIGNVAVGIDPVSLRFRTANEIWVINHISSSVSIVDMGRQQVMATLPTGAGPADVVFAGTPGRAFISCARENTVQVFDPIARVALTNLVIDGERPKAMAVSSDATRVFVAVFESGNASTLLAPPITPFGFAPEEGPVNDSLGPYADETVESDGQVPAAIPLKYFRVKLE